MKRNDLSRGDFYDASSVQMTTMAKGKQDDGNTDLFTRP